MLRILAEERLERRHQLRRVEAAAIADVPGRILPERRQRLPGQFARDHLGIDRVGDAERFVHREQTEIPHVFDIPAGDGALVPADEDRTWRTRSSSSL